MRRCEFARAEGGSREERPACVRRTADRRAHRTRVSAGLKCDRQRPKPTVGEQATRKTQALGTRKRCRDRRYSNTIRRGRIGSQPLPAGSRVGPQFSAVILSWYKPATSPGHAGPPGPRPRSREPLIRLPMGTTVTFRDAWREARCSRYRACRPSKQHCQAPGKPCPFWVCAKRGAGGAGLLGIVDQATTDATVEPSSAIGAHRAPRATGSEVP